MTRRNWLWAAVLGVPLAVAGGLAYANTQTANGYTCPVTGEELPCEKCCPLNGKEQASEQNKGDEQSFICPVTGEELDCPKCCPLNKKK